MLTGSALPPAPQSTQTKLMRMLMHLHHQCYTSQLAQLLMHTPKHCHLAGLFGPRSLLLNSDCDSRAILEQSVLLSTGPSAGTCRQQSSGSTNRSRPR